MSQIHHAKNILAWLPTKHISDAALISISTLLLNAIGLPAMAVIIRSLGPERYGQWSIALSLIALFGFITNLGLRGQFVRSVARSPESAPSLLAEQLSMRFILAVAAATSAVVVCILLQYPLIVVVCTIVGGVGLCVITIALAIADLLQAFHRVKALAAINVTAGLTLTVLSVAAVKLGAGPVGLALSYLVGPVLLASLSVVYVHRTLFRVRWASAPGRFCSLLWGARLLGAQSFIYALATQAEALLIPTLVGISAFGFFAAGTLLSTRLAVIPDSLATAFYPLLSQNYASSRTSFQRNSLVFVTLATVGCFGVSAIITIIAPWLASFLFPLSPAECTLVLQLTIWNLPLFAAANSLSYVLNAAGLEGEVVRSAVVSHAVGFAFSLPLIWYFGLLGACWCMLARSSVTLIAYLLPFARLLAGLSKPVAESVSFSPVECN